MSLSKFTFLAIALAFTFGFAQEYEPDVDSAWVAKQNGGSTELSNGESNEPAPACIGDGCDGTEQVSTEQASSNQAPSESTNSAAQNAEPTEQCTGDGCDNATANCVGDGCDTTGTAKDSLKAAALDSSEYCTPADSLLPECMDDDEDNAYDRYINENAEMYRARKEGFSRKIRIGFRAGGGMNMLFGEKSDNWKPGFDGYAGMFAQMPIGVRSIMLSAEVDFNYRRYNFETSTIYGEEYMSDDEAKIDMMLFEIPVTVLYSPEEEGFFVGLGFDLGLKLSSTSEYKQKVNTDKGIEKDKRKNTLPTSGVELGAIFNLGYAFTRNFAVDIRVVQYFSNLLNEGAIAETEIMKSQLHSFHGSLGISFML